MSRPGEPPRGPGPRSGVREVLLVAAVALGCRLWLFASVEGTALSQWHRWENTDMATFLRQAREIAGGDLALARPVVPYTEWMQEAARADWERWHPPLQLYQPPLYAYLLAGFVATAADPVRSARLVQLALGVALALLMRSLAARLLGRRAGLFAGLAVATYGPLLVVESQLLREAWILPLTTLALLLLADLRHRPRALRALLLGLVIGVDAMLHEGATVLGLLVAGALLSAAIRRRVPALLPAIYLLGAVAGYAPLLARGVLLGTSPAPSYFGSVMAMAAANHGENPDTALTVQIPPRGFGAVMEAAQGSAGRLVPALAATYHGPWWRWPFRVGLRLLALLIGVEHNENLCYAYFKLSVPVLSLVPDFRLLFPLAAAGALLRGRRRALRRLLRGDALGITMAFGLLSVAMLLLVYPYGRYRVLLLPTLAPLAGWSAGALRELLRRRRFSAAARVALLVAAAAALQAAIGALPLLRDLGKPREADFLAAARIMVGLGRPAAAVVELEQALELGDSPEVRLSLVMVRGLDARMRGDREQALREFREALRLDPRNALARKSLEELGAARE